jgi:peroxiredoxin
VGYIFGVGREAPLFNLTAHDGTVVSLSRFRGDWYPVIVFFRPDAAGIDDYLRALGAAAGGLWGVRGQVLAVAVASEEELLHLAERVGTIPIPLLADTDGAVARLYGAWDKDQGDCTPMAYIADRAHKIVWAQNGDAALPPSVAELEKAFGGFVK